MNPSIRTLALLSLGVLAAAAQAEQFKLTVTNNGPQPLSPLFYSAGTSAFDIFSIGGASSLGIKRIAEGGDTSAMLSIAAAAGSAVGTYGVLGGSPLAPGGTRTLFFNADASNPYFSFASMLGKTNDGFIGESVSSEGLLLFKNGVAQSFSYTSTGQEAWDAGTELNTQNATDLGFLGGSGNPAELAGNSIIRVHGGVIPNVGDSWDQMPAWGTSTSLATVSVEAVPEPASMLALGVGLVALLRKRAKVGS